MPKQMGITANYLNMFDNYLKNRSQHVPHGNTKSSVQYNNCDVLQGSILGPLLFLVYVNDIENEIKSDIKLFADDTTLLYSNLNPTSTHFVLTEDLNRISAWAEK